MESMLFSKRKPRVRKKDHEFVFASTVPSCDLFESYTELLKRGLFVVHPFSWLKSNFRSPFVSSLNTSVQQSPLVIYANIVLIDGVPIRMGYQSDFYKLKDVKEKSESGYYLCDDNINAWYLNDMENLGVTEESIQHTLVALKKGLRYECSSGFGRNRIDLMSSNTIAEIKNAVNWKHGIGQLLVYSFLNPDYKRMLILFGSPLAPMEYNLIKAVCNQHEISVEFIDTSNNCNSQINKIPI